MAIRLATLDDSSRVIEMGSRSLDIGPYKDELGNEPDVTARLYELLIINRQARILVSEEEGKITGIFALILYPHYYSGEMTAGEIIWYVEPEHRAGGIGLELLRRAEELAREAGAVRFQLTAPSEALGKLYGRCGYQQLEVSYQRRL